LGLDSTTLVLMGKGILLFGGSVLADHFLTVAWDILSRFLEVMLHDLGYCPLPQISQNSKSIKE